MFAIGETDIEIEHSKLHMPKEYKLNRKGRKIYGYWTGKTLFLSDEENVLKRRSGNGHVVDIKLGSDSEIRLPENFQYKRAKITGCITTIKIDFL